MIYYFIHIAKLLFTNKKLLNYHDVLVLPPSKYITLMNERIHLPELEKADEPI